MNMKSIRINEERQNQILPNNIKDSDVLSDNAKKVLATIMNYFLVLEDAKTNGYVYLNNTTLRQSVGIRMNDLLTSLQELIETDLIVREVGRRRIEGEKSFASVYKVNWENLTKPIKKKSTFEELFSSFLKPSTTPLGTTVTVTDTVSETVTEIDTISDTELETDSISEIDSDIVSKTEIGIDKETKQFNIKCFPFEIVESIT